VKGGRCGLAGSCAFEGRRARRWRAGEALQGCQQRCGQPGLCGQVAANKPPALHHICHRRPPAHHPQRHHPQQPGPNQQLPPAAASPAASAGRPRCPLVKGRRVHQRPTNDRKPQGNAARSPTPPSFQPPARTWSPRQSKGRRVEKSPWKRQLSTANQLRTQWQRKRGSTTTRSRARAAPNAWYAWLSCPSSDLPGEEGRVCACGGRGGRVCTAARQGRHRGGRAWGQRRRQVLARATSVAPSPRSPPPPARTSGAAGSSPHGCAPYWASC
jgi:hypothetical protein